MGVCERMMHLLSWRKSSYLSDAIWQALVSWLVCAALRNRGPFNTFPCAGGSGQGLASLSVSQPSTSPSKLKVSPGNAKPIDVCAAIVIYA